jgi:urea transport system ATP-binding protein
VQVDPEQLSKHRLTPPQVESVLKQHVETIPNATLSGTDLNDVVVVPNGQHPWHVMEAIAALPLGEGSTNRARLDTVAKVRLVGYSLTDNNVKLGLYILTVLGLAGAYGVCRLVVNSRLGRVLVAIRDNENRLRFFGYEPYVFKVLIFSLSAMLAGLGGMLYVPQMLIITPANMQVIDSIMVVIWVAVGGRGTLAGPILGTLVVKLTYYFLTSDRQPLWFAKGHIPDRIYEWTVWHRDYWPFVLGGLFVGIVLFLPDGLISLPQRMGVLWRRWKEKNAKSPSDEPAEVMFEGPDAENGKGRGDLQDHLQRVSLLKRERTISVQQRSLLDTELLRVENIKVLFDGFKALDVDEFSVDYYELQVVIGPNGAGKTTLCDVISGKTRATSGKVFFAKQEITRMPEVDIARLGVGRKFQTPSIFDGLTVYESMELALPGRQSLIRNLGRTTRSEDRDRIDSILKRVRLDAAANQRVKYLSHGQRQWLEISMLLLAGPHLLLVDEPAAGLTDEETALTAELLLELQNEHSVIVIEHDMEFVRLLDSRVTVLNEGKIMAQGSVEQVQADPKVVEAYLGRGGSRHAKHEDW